MQVGQACWIISRSQCHLITSMRSCYDRNDCGNVAVTAHPVSLFCEPNQVSGVVYCISHNPPQLASRELTSTPGRQQAAGAVDRACRDQLGVDGAPSSSMHCTAGSWHYHSVLGSVVHTCPQPRVCTTVFTTYPIVRQLAVYTASI